jgi:ATP-dependent RNA helicase HelY
VQLTAADFGMPPRQLATVALPATYAPNRHDYRREVGRRVKAAKLAPHGRDSERAAASGRPAFDTRSGMHPVEADPDLRARIRAAGQADRVEREIVDLESRVQRHNQSLAREFDGVLGVLSEFGYVDREAWALTDAGEMLARTAHPTIRRGRGSRPTT